MTQFTPSSLKHIINEYLWSGWITRYSDWLMWSLFCRFVLVCDRNVTDKTCHTLQLHYAKCKWEEIVHTGNTSYTADRHPNSTNRRNIRRHKSTLLWKNRKLTETRNKHLSGERWAYRLKTTTDKCHLGG